MEEKFRELNTERKLKKKRLIKRLNKICYYCIISVNLEYINITDLIMYN